jgi:gliding motility-associated-like protein
MTLIKKIAIWLPILILGISSCWAQQQPLEFVENKGQWEAPVKFKGDMNNGAFFLRSTGYTVLQHQADDLRRIGQLMHRDGPTHHHHAQPGVNAKIANPGDGSGGNAGSGSKDYILRSHAYEMDFEGANAAAKIIGDRPLDTHHNYFVGNDSTKWASNVRLFRGVTYQELYRGIDAKYFTVDGSLKYEFLVQPGADPSRIVMKFKGIDGLKIRNNELVIKTSVGDVVELSPYTYQFINNEKKIIDCRYEIMSGNRVRFKIKNYNPQYPLVIDPSLIFATFTGSRADNWGFTATYGSGGTFFAGGVVFAEGYPVSVGAFQQNYASGSGNENFNMGITKFSANGDARIWSTYIGGSGADQPHSMFADAQDNLVIAGRTTSGAAYPTRPAGNNFGPGGDWDIVITKINASGSALIGSMRIGGSAADGVNVIDSRNTGPRELINFYGDDGRSEVILDNVGNIYLASCTQSSNFFRTPNALSNTLGGVQDAVLVKVNPTCTNVLYSSFFGGRGYDAGFVLAINPSNQDIYMAGGTTSDNLTIPDPAVWQTTFQGGISDGYIAVFTNNGSILRRTTYLGTNLADIVFGIQFDRNAYPYVMGMAKGNWPIINASYGQAGAKQFVGKLEKDLSNWVFRTSFGTVDPNPNISPVAFLVDRCENLYISGWGKDINEGNLFPMAGVNGMPITPDAIKSTAPDNEDLYFIVLKRDASALLYGTMYGQNGPFGEHVDGGTSRFDQNGVIYQAICANCFAGGQRPRWPVTAGAVCCDNGFSGAAGTGSRAECNLAALKISFNYAGVGAGVRAFIDGVFDTTGCVPVTVRFRDTINNAQSYEWNFGDGSPNVATDSAIVTHTYNNVGSYRVMLVAIDSSSCNIRDTAYTTIIVRNDEALLGFDFRKVGPCESLSFEFSNLSTRTPSGKPFNNQSFIWDFGDGTRVVAGLNNVTHTFATAGTYTVRLILADTGYCNSPDSTSRELRISPLVDARFETNNSGCAPYNAVFTNTSLAGQTFNWDFGDGTTSTAVSPTHVYPNPGTYTIKLVATDPNTCNVVDSTFVTITVSGQPTAAFTFSPVQPIENTPITFTNTSSFDAIRFVWRFGDGDTLATTSRLPVEHQYLTTGSFNACLEAINSTGCRDTVCTPVEAIIVPKVDVPNAFTPAQNNTSNRVFVKGFGISKMKWIIYNRFGQKVFESNDTAVGWDGRFNGQLQPMDVYAYVLDVEFTDGTKALKKGDITLIR